MAKGKNGAARTVNPDKARKRGEGKSSWFFDGGGKAHAQTLAELGYQCVKWTSLARHMQRGDLTIAVPDEPRLADQTKRYILAVCGHPYEEYLAAWQRKQTPLGCPARIQVAS